MTDAPMAAESERRSREFLSRMATPLGISPVILSGVEFAGEGELPSIFAVSDFAAAAVAAAAAAAGELIEAAHGRCPSIHVNRRLASLWFGVSIRPRDWVMPSPWDAVAGDYRGRDGWIRLHTNAPHHRAAALAVLKAGPDREAVSRAVAEWNIDDLEAAVVEHNGCAAAMRSIAAWAAHPQGESVAREPLIAWRPAADRRPSPVTPAAQRPLAGLRVLDLTRVLAGPVATRFLAGLGADVLRIDAPDWDEPAVVPDVALGKRCARLDLRSDDGRRIFTGLLRDADVLVHGYRADALDRLGFNAGWRREIRPGLIDVTLDAYGWSGPWQHRRGFDSLVQMSAGIAEEGMQTLRKERPTPLPVQALDHATGYLVAAAALKGLTQRVRDARGCEAQTSLARTARLLVEGPRRDGSGSLGAPAEEDWSAGVEASAFGPAQRLKSPVTFDDAPLRWDRAAARLGSSPAAW